MRVNHEPCPGCGRVNEQKPMSHWQGSRWSVKCPCGWIGPHRPTPQAAWEAWDRRAERPREHMEAMF